MTRLAQYIRQLREVNQVHAGSSFMPNGAVGTAHSFPGPEPGKLPSSATTVWAVPPGPDTRNTSRAAAGQDKERTRRERRWQKLLRSRAR